MSGDRNTGRFPVRRVRVVRTAVAGGDILLSGNPSQKCVVTGNRYDGGGKAVIDLPASVVVAGNEGFEVKMG